MKFTLGLVPALAALTILSGGWDALGQQTFRSGVVVVTIDATVTKDGRPVTMLGADDFEILDNDVPQKVRAIETQEAVSLIVIVQAKPPRSARYTDLRVAGQSLLASLRLNDLVSLIQFSDTPELLGERVSDPLVARNLLKSTSAGTRSCLRDALFSGLALATKSGSRPIVLVLTDRVDDGSWLTEAQIIDAVRQCPCSVFVVGPPGAGDWEFLQRVAVESGGQILGSGQVQGNLGWTDDLPIRFAEVVRNYRARYLLSYEPAGVGQGDGWHRIAVKCRRPDVTVTARPGYLAAPESRGPRR